ncbi:glycine-rich domain-containing protein [Nonomuraea sp. NPDC049684]|uniref:glycine-rich domain-containing protein n=1 Tax=unclassified Nonomuraea TaxID=2593643 RepID=UPI00379E86D3
MITGTPLAALDHQAPYLLERLVKERVAATEEEAGELFAEAKKYLVLTQVDRSRIWMMHSTRVDDAWHQFILFTGLYTEFCHTYFGRYVHHSPSNDPGVRDEPAPETPETPPATFAEFRDRYEELFGGPLPDVWYDHRTVTLSRRVVNERAGLLTTRRDGNQVELLSPSGEPLVAANMIAAPALEFAARTGAFYVRELPGGLTGEERVALAEVLVEQRILKVSG